MRRVFVDPGAPQRDAIEEAVTWIRKGGIVAVPTDTLYGIACDPFNHAAVARVFDVKGRERARALPLIAADVAQIERHFGALAPMARQLADHFWPGPLTLVVAAPRALAPEVSAGLGTVGVRVPANEIARAICAGCDRPITATSANLSGEGATFDPDVVERTLGDRLDLLLDAGPTVGGEPSTIVDVTQGEPRLIRRGATAWEAIQAWLNTQPIERARRGGSAPPSSV
jgi:L-threonylcarbamoyladenylate synthase